MKFTIGRFDWAEGGGLCVKCWIRHFLKTLLGTWYINCLQFPFLSYLILQEFLSLTLNHVENLIFCLNTIGTPATQFQSIISGGFPEITDPNCREVHLAEFDYPSKVCNLNFE